MVTPGSLALAIPRRVGKHCADDIIRRVDQDSCMGSAAPLASTMPEATGSGTVMAGWSSGGAEEG